MISEKVKSVMQFFELYKTGRPDSSFHKMLKDRCERIIESIKSVLEDAVPWDTFQKSGIKPECPLYKDLLRMTTRW